MMNVMFEQGEAILYTTRKHWFIFAIEIFFSVFAAFVPLVFFFLPEEFRAVITTINFNDEGRAFFFFLWSLWLLLLWIVAALFWTDYYLDVWLVTNHRVIDIDQKGMFNRRVSTFRFNQIQDVTVEVPGILATLIGFGTVYVRTASEETFKIKGVARPNLLREMIMTEHHRVHGKKTEGIY